MEYPADENGLLLIFGLVIIIAIIVLIHVVLFVVEFLHDIADAFRIVSTTAGVDFQTETIGQR